MKLQTFKFLFLLITSASCTISISAKNIVWIDRNTPLTYAVSPSCSPVVETALEMLSGDLQLVTGQSMRPAKNDGSRLIVYQLDKTSKQAVAQLNKQHIPVNKVRTQMDAFWMGVRNGKIVIIGNNGRGTAYGLLELSRMAGVSPWVWWGDVVPVRHDSLTISETYETFQSPSVTYRGIFINDEDWSLRKWSSNTFEKTGVTGIGPKTYKEIFKLLLRLRANTIWPAMHEGGTGFFTVKGNKDVADSLSILIGTSHCEPLLRNNVAEWNVKERGAYNYMTNRDEVKRYWAARLQEVKGSEKLFTIGMRGIHDGSMEGVTTAEERLSALQQVIDDQRELIKKHYNKNVERVPQVFIPYKEVLEILESGLRVPDDVTMMWCDDNYGYLTRLPDAKQQKRNGGGGVYYHLSYWGRPHDYLWLTTTQPGLIYNEMKTAYEHNCRKLWIANVHEPKVAAYDLELFLDMAWNIESIQPTTLSLHLENWLSTQFGKEVGHLLAPVMQQFYQLNAIRKPEFMGWTQVELDKKKFPGGKSPVGEIEMTTREAADRMEAFGRMKATVEKCRLLIRPELADAYFAHVIYPVYAAAAMTEKMVSDKAGSHRAYKTIQQLTQQYNALNNGKWHGLMDAAPRQLPVFQDTHAQLQKEDSPFNGIGRNASNYTSATPGCQPIQMLGHSMNAVSIPKNGELTFEFETAQNGEAALFIAMIPTQPNDRGDLRYQIILDNQNPITISLKEPYRSERWKQNVLRSQSLRRIPVTISKGKHTLCIKALDDHIIADQWMLDFNTNHDFYVIPASPCMPQAVPAVTHPWQGKRVAYFGDSITDPRNKAAKKKYWGCLADWLQTTPYVYAVSGRQWNDIPRQTSLLLKEHGQEVDAIIVFCGTNDYNNGVPIGKWWDERDAQVIYGHGQPKRLVSRRQRVPSMDPNTFCGRINIAMDSLKRTFPTKQIVLLTPIHRSNFHANEKNWQCDESYSNQCGEFLDAYVEAVKQAGNIWAVPVIDLNASGGLFPMLDVHAPYFNNAETDRLHPNEKGHVRLAQTLYYHLLTIPATF